jgi:arylsulfatase A-like enzyme
MDEQLKAVLARQMEVYAGFLEHTDHHVGRLIQALEELGMLEDTPGLCDRGRQRRQR